MKSLHTCELDLKLLNLCHIVSIKSHFIVFRNHSNEYISREVGIFINPLLVKHTKIK